MKRLLMAALAAVGIAGVAAAAIIGGAFAGRGASVSNAAVNGSATIAVVPPGGSQAIGVPFTVPVNLASFTPGTAATWGGYGSELQYDPNILQANSDVNTVAGDLCPGGDWSAQRLVPDIVTGCFGQSNATTSGVLETITFQCKTDGVSALTFLNTVDGTFLFDESGVNFVMTLTNGSVMCGTGVGATPTFTNTATATNTPLPTNTATSTATPTDTPTGPTQTVIAEATQTAIAAGSATATATTTVTTGNIPVIAISPEQCFFLTAVHAPVIGPIKALSCFQMGQNAVALRTIADFMGNGDGIIQPSDFAGMDLDGNQIHQMDDYGFSVLAGSLDIMAFVPNHGHVEFQTDRGVIVPPLSPLPGSPHPTVDDVGPIWICDTNTGVITGIEDADCDPTGTTPGSDGVVVARLRARYGDSIADRGPGTVTVTQGSTDGATVNFRVVGEPHTLSLTTLETTIQDGITDFAHCPFPGSTAGFLGPNGNAAPEKALVLAVSKDIDGNAISGAIVNWYTDDFDKARMAAFITPTLDLGSFGFGALNIICGGTTTGTVTVSAKTSTDVIFPPVIDIVNVDPQASVSLATTTFTVVGVPAAITLAAVPPQIACDGVATAVVAATVVDAAGNPVAPGQPVTFDVSALGTANPMDTTTDDKGVATSSIAPFGGTIAGVTVNVTAGNVQASLLLSCATPTATPTSTATATATPTQTAAPSPTSTTQPVIFLNPSHEVVPLAAGSAGFRVEVGSATNVAAFQFLLRYDPSVLKHPTVQVGPFLGSTGRPVFCPTPVVDGSAGPGTVLYGCGTAGLGPGVDGSGLLATVTFTLASVGSTSISLEQIEIVDAPADSLCPCVGVGASIDVTAATLTATDTPTSTETVTPTPTDTAVPTATSSPTPKPVCVGDVNGDGVVNVRDLVLVARHMRTDVGDRRYDPTYDLNHDGPVNVRDLMMIIERLGTACP